MDGVRMEGTRIVVQPRGANKRNSGRGPQPADPCYNCGKKGHCDWSVIEEVRILGIA